MPRTKMEPPPRIKPAKGKPVPVGEHMIYDPRICHGKLTFKGTRVPVQTVLYFLTQGRSITSLRKSWPEVSKKAIQEAMTLATEMLVRHTRNGNP